MSGNKYHLSHLAKALSLTPMSKNHRSRTCLPIEQINYVTRLYNLLKLKHHSKANRSFHKINITLFLPDGIIL
jgi:hypothetical protein